MRLPVKIYAAQTARAICTFFPRRKVPNKYAEGVRTIPTPMGTGDVRTFFACTKKVPKKYPEGLRALSTPGDAVKFLRFDGDTANFAVWRKRIKTHFIFTP